MSEDGPSPEDVGGVNENVPIHPPIDAPPQPVVVTLPQASLDDDDLKRRVGEIASAFLIKSVGIGVTILALLITVFAYLFHSHIATNAEEVARAETREQVAARIDSIEESAERATKKAEDTAIDAAARIKALEMVAQREDADLRVRLNQVDEEIRESEERVQGAVRRSRQAADSADTAARNAAAVDQEIARIRAELEGTDVDTIRRELAKQPNLIADRLKADEEFRSELGAVIAGVPVGTILPTALGRDIPDGWIEADGRSVPASDYPLLFRAIGKIFNQPDDPEGTFRVPDLRGRTVIGTDGAVGAVIGAESHRHSFAHRHTTSRLQIPVKASGSTADARFTSRDTQWFQRKHANNFNGERDGFMIYRANEDTLSDSKAQHNHTVSVSGQITIPAQSTGEPSAPASSEASSYQPSMKLRMLIKAR